jgi:arylesterase / paraoxonase
VWKFIKRLLLIVGGLVGVSVLGTVWILARGGAFKKIEPHFAGNCETLPLEASAEDMAIDRERGVAYLSYLDRQAIVKGDPQVQGTIMRLDLTQPTLLPEPALVDAPAFFRPHGLSLYVAPDGARTLVAIAHPAKRGSEPESVVIFQEAEPGRFRMVDQVSSPLFNSPNDLVAVGPRQFYVANDKATGGGLAGGLQQIGIGASPLVYYDGKEARVVASDIASGGGIAASADGNELYVSETAGMRMRVLTRDPATGNVTDKARIPLGTSPDNVDVAADGSLTIGAHANTLALIRHFIGGSPAPSQVLRVIPDNGGQPAIDEIYLDDGKAISAGSGGFTYGNKLLIGSITARQVQVCEAT